VLGRTVPDTSSSDRKGPEEEGDQGILGEEIWRKKCGQQDTSTAGGRWRRQHKTELGGDKWSVDYVTLGATRHKSSKSSQAALSLVQQSYVQNLNLLHTFPRNFPIDGEAANL